MKTSHLTMFGRLILAFFLFAAVDVASAAQIKKIEHKASSGTEEVVLSFDSAVEPRLFTMNGKNPRVVLDFVGASPVGSAKAMAGKGGAVRNVRMGVHRENGLKTRVVLDMASLENVQPRYRIEGDKVIVTLKGSGKAQTKAAAKVPEKMPVAVKKAVAPKTPVTPAEPVAHVEPAGQTVAVVPDEPADDIGKTAVKPETVQSDKPLSARERTKLAREQAAALKKARKDAEEAERMKKEADKAEQEALAQKDAAVEQPKAEVPAEQTVSAQPEQTVPDTPYLSAIQFDPDSPRGELVQFKLNGFYPPVLRSMEKGTPQVVCEFDNLSVAPALRGPIKASGRLVKGIRLDADEAAGKTRVFVELVPGKHYDLQQVFFKEDNFFVLMVNTAKQ